MPKVTAVADKEVIAQGAVPEVSFDDGTTYDELRGLVSIPRVGTEGSFIDVTDITEVVKRFIPGIKTPPEWELAFRRIGNDTVQDNLISAAQQGDQVKIQVTYNTGDVVVVDVVLNGYFADSAEQGDALQMFAVKGQQSGDAAFSKVA